MENSNIEKNETNDLDDLADKKPREELQKSVEDFEKGDTEKVTEDKLDGTDLEENLENEKTDTKEIENNEEVDL